LRSPPLFSLDLLCQLSTVNYLQVHATGSSQCRQECRERSYYNLHRQLNKFLLLHDNLILCLDYLLPLLSSCVPTVASEQSSSEEGSPEGGVV